MSATANGRPLPSEEELEDIILSARYGELDEIEQFVANFGIQHLVDARDDRGNGCLHMAAANGHNGACAHHHSPGMTQHSSVKMSLKSYLRNSLMMGMLLLRLARHLKRTDVLSFLLAKFPKDSLASANSAGNTPLHWAAMNGHLETLRLLVPALPKSALFLQNQFGRTALSEAEANAPAVEEEVSTSTDTDNKNNKKEEEGQEEGGSKTQLSGQQECAGYLLSFMELEGSEAKNGQDGVGDGGAEDPEEFAPDGKSSRSADEVASAASKLDLNAKA